MTLYHGTSRESWTPHAGACLVDDERVARQYSRGGTVYTVEVGAGLAVMSADVDQARRAEMDYPGDRADERAEMVEDGWDVVTYPDETETGRQHVCYRLLSADAVAACVVTDAE